MTLRQHLAHALGTEDAQWQVLFGVTLGLLFSLAVAHFLGWW